MLLVQPKVLSIGTPHGAFDPRGQARRSYAMETVARTPFAVILYIGPTPALTIGDSQSIPPPCTNTSSKGGLVHDTLYSLI